MPRTGKSKCGTFKGQAWNKLNKKNLTWRSPFKVTSGHGWSRVVTGWSRVGSLISSIGRFSQVTVGHGLVTPYFFSKTNISWLTRIWETYWSFQTLRLDHDHVFQEHLPHAWTHETYNRHEPCMAMIYRLCTRGQSPVKTWSMKTVSHINEHATNFRQATHPCLPFFIHTFSPKVVTCKFQVIRKLCRSTRVGKNLHSNISAPPKPLAAGPLRTRSVGV